LNHSTFFRICLDLFSPHPPVESRISKFQNAYEKEAGFKYFPKLEEMEELSSDLKSYN
jgi:hypothetical protein